MTPRALPASNPTYETTLGPADYVAARRLSLSPRPVMRLILLAWALVFFPMCLWLVYFGWVRGRWHPLLLPIFGTGLFLCVYLFVILPWNTRRAYQPHHVVGEFLEGALRVTTDGVAETLPWPLVRGWKRNERMLLLYLDEDVFQVIPLRAFATKGDRDSALALLAQKLGPAHS